MWHQIGMWTPMELDAVMVPQALATDEGVEGKGAIVWHVASAPYATVECRVLDENPDGLRTKLLDIPIADLRPI